MKTRLLLFAIILLFTTCKNTDTSNTQNNEDEELPELMLNAGAGLKPALDEINKAFTEKYNVNVLAQYMCSAMVLSNLILSREGDIFFPGSEYFMQTAIDKKAVDSNSVYPAAYMIPVITTPKGNPKNITSIEDFTKDNIKIGLGDFNILAVGRLTKIILTELDLFEQVVKNQVFVGPNATKLQLNVALGSIDAAINWKGTVLMFGEKTECIDIPIDKLKYSIAPCGISTYSKNRKLAEQYINFVMSDEGQKILENLGFYLPVEADKLEKVE